MAAAAITTPKVMPKVIDEQERCQNEKIQRTRLGLLSEENDLRQLRVPVAHQ
jgi:hypothetical protein